MRRCDVLIVGGGAAGLFAAAQLGENARVLIADGNSKPGKKLLATGNGRCNLTNLAIAPDRYHGDPAVRSVLAQVSAQTVLNAFAAMGLLCRSDEEGRVYPRNLQAAAVLHALCVSCSAQTQLCTETEIIRLKRKGSGFLAATQAGEEIAARRVLLCCGGAASPAHSTGEGYALVKQLGHSVTALTPSLCALRVSGKTPKALKGMRCKARAALVVRGKKLYAESGEVIFGDGQLSGICVFNLSARLRGLSPVDCTVQLDLVEEMTEAQLVSYLSGVCASHPALPAKDLLSGVVNLRVGQELVKQLGVSAEMPLRALSRETLQRLAALMKHWEFSVTGTADWRDAQVTAGGVPLCEVDCSTMESRCCPGLYLAGELLDADGDCGGYNLHWAWATALLAARAIKEGLSC